MLSDAEMKKLPNVNELGNNNNSSQNGNKVGDRYKYSTEKTQSSMIPKNLRYTIDQTVVETRQLYNELVYELP